MYWKIYPVLCKQISIAEATLALGHLWTHFYCNKLLRELDRCSLFLLNTPIVNSESSATILSTINKQDFGRGIKDVLIYIIIHDFTVFWEKQSRIGNDSYLYIFRCQSPAPNRKEKYPSPSLARSALESKRKTPSFQARSPSR